MPRHMKYMQLFFSVVFALLPQSVRGNESEGVGSHFYWGLEYGPEPLITLPPLIGVNLYFRNAPWFYYGGKLNLFLLVTAGISASAHVGLDFGPLVLESNIAGTAIACPAPNCAGYSYLTVNPKVGIELFDIQLRVGPSFLIAGEQGFERRMFASVNGVLLNFELVFFR